MRESGNLLVPERVDSMTSVRGMRMMTFLFCLGDHFPRLLVSGQMVLFSLLFTNTMRMCPDIV